MQEQARPKTCATCAHRVGSLNFHYATCDLSGVYCSVARQYPARCGVEFKGWVQREPLLERVKFWLYKK